MRPVHDNRAILLQFSHAMVGLVPTACKRMSPNTLSVEDGVENALRPVLDLADLAKDDYTFDDSSLDGQLLI